MDKIHTVKVDKVAGIIYTGGFRLYPAKKVLDSQRGILGEVIAVIKGNYGTFANIIWADMKKAEKLRIKALESDVRTSN